MKRVLFIGNRPGVFAEITKFKELDLVSVFVLAESFLHTEMKLTDLEYVVFSLSDKQQVFETIFGTEFDILISNGCPFIMPVSKMKRPHQLFVNIHPSYLPDLRGLHPANGALLCRKRFTGATMHYMDDGTDTGNIIYQEKIEVTQDLDLGLLYHLLFDLEPKVFLEGMRRLREAHYQYPGQSQTGPSSHYTRSERDMAVDLASMSDDEIVTRTRAFGIRSQGVVCVIGGKSYRIFDAEVVSNVQVLNEYIAYPASTLLLEYDDKLLVKTRDGIVKVKSYERLEG